jgi:hypothetical protein
MMIIRLPFNGAHLPALALMKLTTMMMMMMMVVVGADG